MRHLLNTLFILTEDSYLSLENENVVVRLGEDIAGRVPLITLENILYFGYKGASPALMGACAKRGIALCFLSTNGYFLARVCGKSRGNVLLRKQQYRVSEDESISCEFARNFIVGKIYNSRSIVERMKRDHPLNIDSGEFKRVSHELLRSMKEAKTCQSLDNLRGVEGNAARIYFSIFDHMILQNKNTFFFNERNKRPPTDCVNAMLSFVYTLLAHDCAAALESVGLDSYVGFMHKDHPGRYSLALDLMEELRGVFADRFVLTLINNRIITKLSFLEKENGVVFFNDAGKKTLLKEWQERKKEKITHPFLKEKIYWGLVPYVQSLLLARCLRGDLDEYPAFLWK